MFLAQLKENQLKNGTKATPNEKSYRSMAGR